MNIRKIVKMCITGVVFSALMCGCANVNIADVTGEAAVLNDQASYSKINYEKTSYNKSNYDKSNAVDSSSESFDFYEMEMQKSFTIGGITISGDDADKGYVTGTELTNAVEDLLLEKYGEEFCCEQNVYYDEYSLMLNLEAYPKANPKLRFPLDVMGKYELEIWWDEYYNVLFQKEIDDYIYPALEPYGIGKDEFFAIDSSPITTNIITKETFADASVTVYISVPEDRLDELIANMQDIISSLNDRLNTGQLFFIKICHEGIDYDEYIKSNKYIKNNRIWNSYSINPREIEGEV